MATLKQQIIELVDREPGLTDRQITDRLKGPGHPPQAVNQACRQLERGGVLHRKRRDDGLIGNYPSDKSAE